MNLKRKLKMLKITYCADVQVIYCETLHSQLDLRVQYYSEDCTYDLTKKSFCSAFYYYITQNQGVSVLYHPKIRVFLSWRFKNLQPFFSLKIEFFRYVTPCSLLYGYYAMFREKSAVYLFSVLYRHLK
jgi:hypothetical protein